MVEQLVALSRGGVAPEAAPAAAAFRAVAGDVERALLGCWSGAELLTGGHRDDVLVAAELDASGSGPVLRDGCSSAA